MVKEQILQWAINDFARLGVKGVSMSHIARELRISKKTIYDFFESKQELLVESMEVRVKQNSLQILEMEKSANSSLEAILLINRTILKNALSLCPAFYYEMSKIAPLVEMMDNQVQFISDLYRKYFKIGIEDGLFPENYDYESTLSFFEERIRSVCLNQSSNKIKEIEIYSITIFTYLAGVCTNKGREELAKFNKKQFYIN